MKRFADTYKFCKDDINNFILLLRGAYSYEYMDDWEKIQWNIITTGRKEHFYSHLNIEHITDVEYNHAKRVCKDYEKKLGEYNDFYVHSDTLLLGDIFSNFRSMCLKIYGLDPAHFLSAPRLA